MVISGVGPLQTPLADFACIAQSPLSVSGGATAIGEQPLKGLPGAAVTTKDPKVSSRNKGPWLCRVYVGGINIMQLCYEGYRLS